MKTRIWNLALLALLLAAAILPSPAAVPERGGSIAPYRYLLSSAQGSDVDLDFLERRVARSPEGLDLASLAGAYLKKARQSGERRFIEKAEDAARRSLEILPDSNPGASLALARAAQTSHDFERSLSLAEGVLRERPGDAGALSVRSTALLAVGRLQEAVETADLLVDRSPISEHFAARAVVHAARGEEREAIHDFRKAWRLEEPGDPEGSAWFRALWARLSLERGRIGEAEELLRESLRIRPFLPLALGLLGDLEMLRGSPDAADRAYADAYQASGDPSFLARRARARGGPEAREIRSAAEKALREAPGHGLQLAQVLLDRGDPEALREALGLVQAEASRRQNAETLRTLAAAYLANDRPRDARTAIRRALRTGLVDAGLHGLAAEIESRLRCTSLAEMHRAAAREIRP